MNPITYDRRLGVVDQYPVIDLFPYKTQDIGVFIHRDHIPYKENSQESLDYSRKTWRRGVEGLWVTDGDRAIWMPPKLFTYINLGTIDTSLEEGDKSRVERYPDLRDNEWIGFTYLLCCDGFSGFSDDPDFTCNVRIRDIENSIELAPKTLKRLEKNCRRKDGTWKKYIEAWDYLTWFYNKENPSKTPLGRALYENNSYNGLWLASRKFGKTFMLGGGDATHEFWTNGAMSYEDLKRGTKINMMLGASDSKYIKSFMESVRVSFTNIPGGGLSPHPLFTRTATNDWGEKKGIVEQRFRRENGTFGGSKSQFNKAVIEINSPEVVVSTRSKRIYVDEIGLLENAKDVFGAADSTLKDQFGKFGILFGTGTGGNIEKIAQTQYLFENPSEFDIYPIPNYWVDNKDIGLFGPASYTLSEYKDENGNTDLMAGTRAILADRDRISGGERNKQTDRRLNEPLVPYEMFLAGKSDVFDKDAILNRIEILNRGEFDKKAKVVELQLGAPAEYNGISVYDVITIDKPQGLNNVVREYNNQYTKTGEVVIFEDYIGDGREFLEYNNLHKVTLDPKTDLETGESYMSVIVWKGRPQRALEDGEMFHNIVATAKLKDGDFKPFLLLCLKYRSRGQYERNVNGIPDFFAKFGLQWLLQPTPIAYIKDITPGTRQSQQSGIFMTDQLRREATKLLQRMHKSIVHIDGLNRKFKHCETWYALDLLYEMVAYDDERNFDCISAMRILMLWLESEFIPEDSKFYEESLETDMEWEDMFKTAKRILA